MTAPEMFTTQRRLASQTQLTTPKLKAAAAAFDFTVHGHILDIGFSNTLLIRSCSTPGAAAHDAKERKIDEFTRREQEVALDLRTDRGTKWNRSFQFFPFWMDTHLDFGPEARKAFEQLATIRKSRFNKSQLSCRRKILRTAGIANITACAKMMSYRRTQPSHVEFDSSPRADL